MREGGISREGIARHLGSSANKSSAAHAGTPRGAVGPYRPGRIKRFREALRPTLWNGPPLSRPSRFSAQAGFREDLYRARQVRGDWAFGEQILDMADDSRNDWLTHNNGKQIPNKELVLRSKLRIEA